MTGILPIDEILRAELSGRPAVTAGPEALGSSREGRPIEGHRYGRGDIAVSLIGGCHADEPVGPKMLRLLCGYLERAKPDDPLLTGYSWYIVPDVNPDGERRNRAWSQLTVACLDHGGRNDRGFDLSAYLEHVIRELPGDDIEFGFPRHADDDARPENRAVAGFLRDGAPFALHGSFHGMDFAVGPWFLIEAAWAERTTTMRETLRRLVRALGYRLFDVDRGGEKGFTRIDEGFTTRPDSVAMIEHFERLDDPETAARFRPSSMEFVRGLGGDPLTIVSEMPLFLQSTISEPPGTGLKRLIREQGREGVQREAERVGLRPMPIRDQMRLQLAFLGEGLTAIGQ